MSTNVTFAEAPSTPKPALVLLVLNHPITALKDPVGIYTAPLGFDGQVKYRQVGITSKLRTPRPRLPDLTLQFHAPIINEQVAALPWLPEDSS